MKDVKVFVGARFFRLIVLSKVSPRKWKVRCDCGVEKIVCGGNLLHNTKSCGCLKREGGWIKSHSKKPFGVSSRNTVLSAYKKEAEERGYVWKLLDNQFDEITKQNCFYCGKEPNNINYSRCNNGNFIYSGIDRVNNSLGYTPENVVPCCRRCNRAKDVMSQEEFIAWINRVAEHTKALIA